MVAAPIVPSGLKINGTDDVGPVIPTLAVSGAVTVSAIVDDADPHQQVLLQVYYSTDLKFSHYYSANSAFGAQGRRVSVRLNRLTLNTLWYVRAYTRDKAGKISGVNTAAFYTDRFPTAPTLVAPNENVALNPATTTLFDWQVNDPDAPGVQTCLGFQLRFRTTGTPLTPPGGWVTYSGSTNVTSFTLPANILRSSNDYEWQVRTRDPQLQWGEWSLLRSFSTIGPTRTPVPVAPGSDVVVNVEEAIAFKWKFSDAAPGATQGNANIRYRVRGTPTWTTLFGSSVTDQSWVFAPDTFAPGYRYEWQVQTIRDSGDDPDSDWSASATFWTILTPGRSVTDQLPLGAGVVGNLGVGNYRVYIYDRGGAVRRGEIKRAEMGKLTYNRKRDDLSTASVPISNFSEETKQLLRATHTWANELVIERDGERVWEGPITLINDDASGTFTISAHDVLAYAYRRIMRQGYNDSYRIQAGVQVGIRSVVDRAGAILTNALGYAEPNVLPYLTLLTSGTDADEARIVPDYTKSAWEEVDELAQNGGLDYTVIGRRPILWGTHSPVGVLPEMSDGNFTEPLKVTEYGMNAANYYAVTDGQGAWGAAYPVGKTEDDWDEFYGPLEMIDSGYGVTDSTAGAADITDPADLTPQALATLQADLKSQAKRNIATRWPAPLVVRVPDNSGITPNTNVTLAQLIPGVWIPVRTTKTVRPFAQMQKLDSVNVTFENGNETIAVVMGPAPVSGVDPDANGTDDGGEDVDA